jgi:SAM-dependent methyltransferase
VTVHGCSLEDWPLEPHAFAAVTAAQSWHWVDPVVGAAKAADALRPGGWIALFWNRPAIDDCEWHNELQPIYERIAPELAHNRLIKKWAPASEHIDKLLHDERFGPAVVRECPWSERYSTEAYINLLGTHSDHRLLPDAQRAELHGALAESISARGGEIDHPYVTDLIAAPVR